jgi:prepilin-type N-terminal cleavage/methylation domain-containing protein
VRAGFSLAEVLVALVLLAVGALALTAAAGRTHAAARDSRHREAALAEAAWILDSLSVTPSPAAGEREAGGLRLRWTAGDGGLRVEVVDRRDRVVALLAGAAAVRLPPAPGPR